MSNTAAYGIFRVQSNGGNVVYEDYNCFVRLDGAAPVYHYSANWPTLYSTSKIGPHTIQQNPLFVNAAAGDFHLASNSPCLNASKPDIESGYPLSGYGLARNADAAAACNVWGEQPAVWIVNCRL